MSSSRKFEVGERVIFQRTPSSTMWIEATYLGLFTIHYGHRPWHMVQVNADKHIVPLNRIRKPTAQRGHDARTP